MPTKVDLNPFIRQSRSAKNEFISLDNLTFQTKHYLWNFNKDAKDDEDEHFQLTIENRSVIIDIEALKKNTFIMAEDFVNTNENLTLDTYV